MATTTDPAPATGAEDTIIHTEVLEWLAPECSIEIEKALKCMASLTDAQSVKFKKIILRSKAIVLEIEKHLCAVVDEVQGLKGKESIVLPGDQAAGILECAGINRQNYAQVLKFLRVAEHGIKKLGTSKYEKSNIHKTETGKIIQSIGKIIQSIGCIFETEDFDLKYCVKVSVLDGDDGNKTVSMIFFFNPFYLKGTDNASTHINAAPAGVSSQETIKKLSMESKKIVTSTEAAETAAAATAVTTTEKAVEVSASDPDATTTSADGESGNNEIKLVGDGGVFLEVPHETNTSSMTLLAIDEHTDPKRVGCAESTGSAANTQPRRLARVSSLRRSFGLTTSELKGCADEINQTLEAEEQNSDSDGKQKKFKSNLLHLKSMFEHFYSYIKESISDDAGSKLSEALPGDFIFTIFKNGPRIEPSRAKVMITFIENVRNIVNAKYNDVSFADTHNLDHFNTCLRCVFVVEDPQSHAEEYKVFLGRSSKDGTVNSISFYPTPPERKMRLTIIPEPAGCDSDDSEEEDDWKATYSL